MTSRRGVSGLVARGFKRLVVRLALCSNISVGNSDELGRAPASSGITAPQRRQKFAAGNNSAPQMEQLRLITSAT
jgi:hypothetical protein